MKKFFSFILLLIFCYLNTIAQSSAGKFLTTHADTLRGSYGATRNWWNVLKYDLHTDFDIPDSTISGFNVILLKVLRQFYG